MLGLLAPTVVALTTALVLGGSLKRLVSSTVRGWPAIVVGFVIELALFNPPINCESWAMQIGPWVWVSTRVVLLAVLFANAWPPRTSLSWPWLVAALGVGLNTLVIVLNSGHMPQSPEAASAIWGASHIDSTRLQNVVSLGEDARLPLLADVIPEPSWIPRPNVISLGDILLALGVASWIFASTRKSQSATTFSRVLSENSKIASRIAKSIDGVARGHRTPA